MRRPLGAIGIGDRNHHVANHRGQMTVAVLRDRLVLDRHLAVEIRLDERLLVDLRGATDVEGTHRQLGTGLTDRLRGDDADSLPVVDRGAAGRLAGGRFTPTASPWLTGVPRARSRP